MDKAIRKYTDFDGYTRERRLRVEFADVENRVGTQDRILLVPQSRQRINSGRSPCRRIASENRDA